MDTLGKKNNWRCGQVRVERVVRPSTRKIILTDSSLYNVWTYANLKTADHHMEIEAVVGARIRDLTKLIFKLYLKHPQRLEIVLVAGINNIGDGQPVSEIVEEIKELRESLQAHSTVYKHSMPSVLSISTVVYAPKFCSLEVPANLPEWQPPPGFTNRRLEIEALNAAIAAMNKESGVNYLKLHMEGIRIDAKRNKTMHKHNPKSPIWREPEIRKRLHMTEEYKVRIVNLAKIIFRGGLR